MSGLLGFSRQAYYQQATRQLPRAEQEQQVLALVRDILLGHGFAFQLETQPDGRTAFTIALPSPAEPTG